MVATVDVQEGNGSSVTWTTITAARFCLADAFNPGQANPCVIPPSGQYFSWWKHFLLDITGTFTLINNVRLYCDGSIDWSFGTTGALQIALRDAGDHGCPTGDYQQSAGSGDTGYEIHDNTNGHAYYKEQTAVPVDIEDYTSGSPITIDSTDHSSAEKTKAAVMQLKTDNDATQGDQPDEDLVYLYDEI